MAKTIQAIRGMHDILPQDMPAWQALEATFRELAHSYGYGEIRMPLVEKTELFVRTIGEVTDIVEKEMYTFEDLNGDQLTLRPEGTAGCVRACIEHGLIHNQVQRLWYSGPMFRHERPQKGRYRQFFQIGAEAYGMLGPDVDAELILMTARLWKKLGIQGLQLQLNSLGSREARRHYRDILVAYMSDHAAELDEDSKRRLHTNPLRILDSKNPAMQPLIEGAPRLADSLDEESARHFTGLLAILDNAGIAYTVNPRLVRGLDYYEKTVFEWVSDRLGAQGTVCAGGRYDGLIEHLGGRPAPAAGFALGMERLLALIEEGGVQHNALPPHLYFIIAGDGLASQGLALAESLRDWRVGLRVMVSCSGGSFKSQMKKADRSQAPLALILGEDEAQRNEIAVKFLRREKPQATVSQAELIAYLDKVEEINII